MARRPFITRPQRTRYRYKKGGAWYGCRPGRAA
jgi:hypothetical protein